MRRLVTSAALLAIVACGGSGEGGTNPPPPAAVASVTLSQPDATLEIGQTVSLSAIAKDAAGLTLSGRTIVWASSAPAVASVSNGLVTALSVGTTTISATSEGKHDEATITVKLPAVATVVVDPSQSFVKVGDTKQLAITLKDGAGNTLQGRTVTWESSDQTRATVANGLVTGVAAGSVIITATSEGKSATAAILVTSGEPPVIASISPATLTPGISATITGTNFKATASDNVVTIAGVPVTVTAATETQLTLSIGVDFPCLSTQAAPVVVTTIGGPATRQHPLQVATQRVLGVGETLLLNSVSESTCNELSQTGGQYMVMLYNASTTPSSVASFQLRGNTPAPGISPLRIPLATARTFKPTARRLPEATLAAGVREHLAMLESDRALVRRLGMPRRRAMSRTRGLNSNQLAANMAPVPTTVGAIATLRMRSGTSCSTYDEIGARVVYVGTKAIVLEDTLSPLAKTIDADYTTIGQSFDNVMYPLLTQYFGDPLAADALTDANGRILMLFTPKVNARSAGLLGFVSPCDFFPQSDVPSSNLAEIFYARAPLQNDPTKFNIDNLELWRTVMRPTVMHESKHLAAVAERVAAPYDAQLEESWLEEGTAQVALELYARTVYGAAVGWKTNSTYAQTIYCDVRTRITGPCLGSQFLIADPMEWLYSYLADNETRSFLSPGSQDGTIYGSAWMFARWLTDQYATDEAAFLKAIVLDGHRTGVANIEDKVGRPFAELTANYLLALALDDYPGLTPPTNARYRVPSWNLPTIFDGFRDDFQVDSPPYTIHSSPFGSFTTTVQALNGVAGAYVKLTGAQTAKQLLDLRSSTGAVLPPTSTLRMAIVRMQ